MTQPSNNVVNQDDEIDLVALMFSLWKRKWTIIWTAIVFAIASIIYVLVAPQVWTSTATITTPQVRNLVEYLNNIEEYSTIQTQNELQSQIRNQSNMLTEQNNSNGPVNTTNTPRMSSSVFTKGQDLNWIFTQFKTILFSRVYQADYLKNTTLYQEYIKDGKTPNQALNLLFKDVKVTKFDDKDSPFPMDAIVVSFNAKTPKLAQELLTGLIDSANKFAQQNILSNQHAQGKVLQTALEVEANRLSETVDAQKVLKLQKLKQALQTAKDAGITQYSPLAGIQKDDNVKSVNSDSLLFMLGEKYLSAQIAALETSSTIYPPRYYQLEAQLNALKKLNAHKQEIQFSTYSYQDTPSYPVSRTKPKRAIIVIAGTVAGGVVGVLIALFMNAVATYRRKENMPE